MKIKLLCAAALCALPAAAAFAQKSPDLAPAARSNAIAFKFYAGQAAGPGNLFFSPYSLHTAFSMAYEGAKGPTAAQIAAVFAFPADAKKLRANAAALRQALDEAAKGADFTQANAFWAEQTYKFLPAYTGTLALHYNAEARGANFKTAPEVARRAINAWTAERTKGKIPELFAPKALTPLTRLVLVNAVYFKGTWAQPFAKALTGTADFTKTDGKKVRVQMMGFSGAKELEYGETGDLQLLRLPYSGGKLAMLLALPKDDKKLSEVFAGFSESKLAELRAALVSQKTRVFLPRFTFSSGFNLNAALEKLGMPLAFSDAADFSGMDGTRRLFIQQAVHKAFVEVNEDGTEAAAATGIAVGAKSAAGFNFALFRADRPFFFLIEDVKSGLVLFMGKVEDPTAAE
ncbi:MAG: serpin family protein [Elusimicrobiales bacterium]|nr:serpin family protein [Elusimicrobiales bacterium]